MGVLPSERASARHRRLRPCDVELSGRFDGTVREVRVEACRSAGFHSRGVEDGEAICGRRRRPCQNGSGLIQADASIYNGGRGNDKGNCLAGRMRRNGGRGEVRDRPFCDGRCLLEGLERRGTGEDRCRYREIAIYRIVSEGVEPASLLRRTLIAYAIVIVAVVAMMFTADYGIADIYDRYGSPMPERCPKASSRPRVAATPLPSTASPV